jgi:hypothetical protein
VARLILVSQGTVIKGNLSRGRIMGTQAQDSGNQNRANQPPTPGGDPDQAPKDLPTPRAGQDKGKDKTKDKEGFGHIGNKDVPSSKGTPEPHDIF